MTSKTNSFTNFFSCWRVQEEVSPVSVAASAVSAAAVAAPVVAKMNALWLTTLNEKLQGQRDLIPIVIGYISPADYFKQGLTPLSQDSRFSAIMHHSIAVSFQRSLGGAITLEKAKEIVSRCIVVPIGNMPQWPRRFDEDSSAPDPLEWQRSLEQMVYNLDKAAYNLNRTIMGSEWINKKRIIKNGKHSPFLIVRPSLEKIWNFLNDHCRWEARLAIGENDEMTFSLTIKDNNNLINGINFFFIQRSAMDQSLIATYVMQGCNQNDNSCEARCLNRMIAFFNSEDCMSHFPPKRESTVTLEEI